MCLCRAWSAKSAQVNEPRDRCLPTAPDPIVRRRTVCGAWYASGFSDTAASDKPSRRSRSGAERDCSPRTSICAASMRWCAIRGRGDRGRGSGSRLTRQTWSRRGVDVIVEVLGGLDPARHARRVRARRRHSCGHREQDAGRARPGAELRTLASPASHGVRLRRGGAGRRAVSRVALAASARRRSVRDRRSAERHIELHPQRDDAGGVVRAGAGGGHRLRLRGAGQQRRRFRPRCRAEVVGPASAGRMRRRAGRYAAAPRR